MDSFRLYLLEATTDFQSKLFDPALMTFEEFVKKVNPQCKTHPDSAYNMPLSKFSDNKSKYPTILYRKPINGLNFEFRSLKEDRYKEKFVKMDPQTQQPLRIGNEIQYYTVPELEALKFRRYNYSFSVFNDNQQVGFTSDEWGCVLVTVAQEYRNFGIGPMLLKLAWEAEPGKDSGGMTNGGYEASRKVHAMFVQEYLQKGFYSHLVQQGQLTPQRVKQILSSAKKLQANPERDLGSNDPEHWLLYGADGAFILYDKKLKTLIDEGKEDDNSFWYDRFIKGTSFIGGGYHSDGKYYLHQLGGDTPGLKQFMFRLALSWAKKDNSAVKVFDDDKDVLDPNVVEILKDGFVALKVEPINYKPMIRQEKIWRKQFDKYDEFKHRLLEMAEAKFRG